MSNSAGVHGAVPSDGSCPLPSRPDLEFERKRAKRLLRQFKRGDREAKRLIDAVRAPGSAHGLPDDCKLTDAQFAIAREYGFSSWPKLVTYYETWGRHVRGGARGLHNSEYYDFRVRSILADHRAHRTTAGQMIATFVPRFYGKRNEEIFAATLTEDDARLVVTREARCSTWAELCDRVAATSYSSEALYQTPFGQALLAIRARNVSELAAILDAHPELLKRGTSPEVDDSLVRNALVLERRDHAEAARQITEFLVSRGAELEEALNVILICELNARTDDIAYWLDRGADPSWIPANGISTLEHALLRYWNGAAVDLIAKRVTAPSGFWIAAGLGDVDAMSSYFDRNGVLLDAARHSRPDFTAVGPASLPSSPSASDDDLLWEAFLVAGLNDRVAVLDALLARGVDIDAAPWGQTLLHVAVGNAKVDLVEHLVKRGANLDLKGWRPNNSAREIAAERFQQDKDNPAVSRIYEMVIG